MNKWIEILRNFLVRLFKRIFDPLKAKKDEPVEDTEKK